MSRSGKFGLLDRAGAEYVPCTYDGLVWDGGTAWVKLDDGWHQYTIPGVTKPDPLDDLPEDITAPDTRTFSYARVITEGGRLNLRAGPGTEYDIVGKIPEYTSLRIVRFFQYGPRLGAGAVSGPVWLDQPGLSGTKLLNDSPGRMQRPGLFLLFPLLMGMA